MEKCLVAYIHLIILKNKKFMRKVEIHGIYNLSIDLVSKVVDLTKKLSLLLKNCQVVLTVDFRSIDP